MGENRRDHGGINRIKTYPCFQCNAVFESYSAHTRHISRVHGKSQRSYDRMLRDEMEGKGQGNMVLTNR